LTKPAPQHRYSEIRKRIVTSSLQIANIRDDINVLKYGKANQRDNFGDYQTAEHYATALLKEGIKSPLERRELANKLSFLLNRLIELEPDAEKKRAYRERLGRL
jgi:hypothetical protein